MTFIQDISHGCRKVLRGLLGKPEPDVRRQLAESFIKGTGLEVGALHSPLWVPAGARITYVDRMSVEDLRKQYPELNDLPLVHVDLIDDGERLTKVRDESQDFVISNHFIEHTQDPIGTLSRHLAVLKPGAVLYMAVPDMRYTFDVDRPLTDFAHMLRDHREGPAWSYDLHLREYAELVDKKKGAEIEAHVGHLRRTNYSIHFHTFTPDSFREFLTRLATELKLPMILEQLVSNPARGEAISIIRRR